MHSDPPSPAALTQAGTLPQAVPLLLGIDTCGPSGSVALARLAGDAVEILGQIELEGRSYSATLVAAVGELLARSGVELRNLAGIVAVNGPGSFTGVRVGLSAVKGLAEAAQIPVVAVSRLEVLARKAGVPADRSSSVGWKAWVPTDRSSSVGWKAGVPSAALDAHRHELFLRLGGSGLEARELLAGAHELSAIDLAGARIAVCEDAAAALLASAWPDAELLRTPAPTAADALELCAPRVVAGEFVDLALLDGHYLRRSDAEIFGEPAAARPQPA
jgi:tRNA threonylcarbamoyladenosine biosynthesis protein TsaB